MKEIPNDCLEEIRLRTQVSWQNTAPVQGRFSHDKIQDSFETTGFKLGQLVRHPKFGDGVVLNYEGVGAQSRVQVNFQDAGAKWLVVAYARLEALS